VGYLSYGPDAANVLFQVVNDRYLHQRPMIFTTNKPLAAWGRVLHDPDLAEAILDRVLERGRHIELRGRSYRTRHAPLDLNLAQRHHLPNPTEFPENTRQSFRNVHRSLRLLTHAGRPV
jgi:IstB-like ATP binding protein